MNRFGKEHHLAIKEVSPEMMSEVVTACDLWKPVWSYTQLKNSQG